MIQIPRDQIDPEADRILRRLAGNHHESYLVGGCVRDLLLGRKPKDFDIATGATPWEIKALFRNCRIIGRRFRLAHIFFGAKIIETATFRAHPRPVDAEAAEGAEGSDGALAVEEETDLLIRHDNVFGTAEEDAQRRDFTINGLFYDIETEQVIDYVGGLADLATRTVRVIGDATTRFREDPIRILRAIKFAARLDFSIEPGAYQAIIENKWEIPKSAPPRVLEEAYRFLREGAAVRSFALLQETGLLTVLMPSLAAWLDPAEATPEVMPAVERFWQVLERLDSNPVIAPSNSFLMAIFTGPLLGSALFDDLAPGELAALFEARVQPLLTHLRVSRRDCERVRLILFNLRRFMPSRRRRPSTLLRRDFFDDALQVFRFLGGVYLDPQVVQEEIVNWCELRKQQQAGEDPAAAVVTRETRHRRRRRRGGWHRSNAAPPSGSTA